MATTLTKSSAYAGKVAGEIFGKALASGDTLSRNLITVMADIDYKIALRKVSYTNGRVDYACGFSPQGSITLSEKSLEPKKIKNELDLCKEELRQLWSSATMGFSAHNDKMPKDLNAAIINEVVTSTVAEINADLWTGVTGTSGEFDGFLTLWAADAGIRKCKGSGADFANSAAAIDSTNVVDKLNIAIGAMTPAMRKMKNTVVLVSSNVYQAYSELNIGKTIDNGLGGASIAATYGKYTLEEVLDLPDNTVAIYDRKNLIFGTGLTQDHNRIDVKEMDDLSDSVRFKQVYTAGVQYIAAEDIVWFVSTVASVV